VNLNSANLLEVLLDGDFPFFVRALLILAIVSDDQKQAQIGGKEIIKGEKVILSKFRLQARSRGK
jgi:hypothetical protein